MCRHQHTVSESNLHMRDITGLSITRTRQCATTGGPYEQLWRPYVKKFHSPQRAQYTYDCKNSLSLLVPLFSSSRCTLASRSRQRQKHFATPPSSSEVLERIPWIGGTRSWRVLPPGPPTDGPMDPDQHQLQAYRMPSGKRAAAAITSAAPSAIVCIPLSEPPLLFFVMVI